MLVGIVSIWFGHLMVAQGGGYQEVDRTKISIPRHLAGTVDYEEEGYFHPSYVVSDPFRRIHPIGIHSH